MKRLRIINNDNSNDVYVESGKLISDNAELEFSGYSSIDEAITAKDLSTKLENRGWELTENIVFSDSMFKSKEYDQEESMPTNFIDKVDLGSSSLYSIQGKAFDESDKDYIKSEYSSIINNDPGVDIFKEYDVDLRGYLSTSNILDTINLDFITFENSVTCELLSDEEYTSIVNLADIQGKSGFAEICIKYSISGNIYTYNTVINIFGGNVIENIDDLIFLEYIGRVLRVIPTSTTVDECIINNCRITYGRL